jgi:hypothetical protein
MDQFIFVNVIGVVFHVYAIGKQPEFPVAEEIVIDMGSGDRGCHWLHTQCLNNKSVTL